MLNLRKTKDNAVCFMIYEKCIYVKDVHCSLEL